MVDIPDLAQTFVVTCCLMNIPFRFTGLQSLKIKETDRITALITELRKLGYAYVPSRTASCCGMANAALQKALPLSPPTKITVWQWHLPPPASHCRR